jgi:putative membrane protein
MRGFILRTLISALGLWAASAIVPGVDIRGGGTLLIAAILYGVVNALVRPVLVILTFPLTLVTLGLFLLVVNAAMFGLVAAFLEGFSVTSFFPALLGAIVVSIVSWFASGFIGSNGKYEVLVVRRR